jgi:hypothetical protein
MEDQIMNLTFHLDQIESIFSEGNIITFSI